MATAAQKITLSSSRDIPFNKLVLSQSNVRRVKAGVSVEELAESIVRRGLIQSLHVRPVVDADGQETGMFEVPAGGRRYRALELLVKQKRLNKTAPVPCVMSEAGGDILIDEVSLAENIERAPLHPLDQFRAFQAMREKGMTQEEIAAAFFVDVKVVKQRLRLASVSPTLLETYAEDGMTLEQLMAFTVSPDHGRQEQVWAAIKDGWQKEPYTIRRMLTETAVRASDKRAVFVGIDAYEEAGGIVLRDLFQSDDGGCATNGTPQFSYDADVPPLPTPPAATADDRHRPLHTPPAWTVARGGEAAGTPAGRVGNANAAARVEPRREGYYNAIQIYPWSEGALYQVYAAPGQITNIALEPGERLTGAGPIAAGDTTRWIIGDTTSGSGGNRRVHILVKPTRPDISTNLVVTTDRRLYMMELHAREEPYMPAVAWAYPTPPAGQRQTAPTAPVIPAPSARNHRYGLQVQGDSPPWRPVSVFDNGRRVFVVFPRGIVQGEMPPLFVLGSDGEPQIVNSRIHQNILIVDRLFGAAELRLGSGNRQQVVRIVRNEHGQATTQPASPTTGGSSS